MNKRVASTAVAGTVAAGLVFGLTGCSDKPPADFAKRCKHAHGKTMREDDFENLGMAPMAFEIGRGGGSKGGSKSSGKSSGFGSGLKGLFGGKSKSKSPKVRKAPKNNGWKLAGGSHGTKHKKSKKHKSDDNEWVCVKNGVELFDED